MNSEQIASLTAIQSNIENGNSGARNGNGRAPNSGDGCCINGVGSKTRELLDRVPPCTGKRYRFSFSLENLRCIIRRRISSSNKYTNIKQYLST